MGEHAVGVDLRIGDRERRAVEQGGGEDVLDRHHGRPGAARAVPQRAADDLQVARRWRGGALVDHLADAGAELLVRNGQVAADDDHLWVECIHEAGQDLAEVAPGVADEPYGVGVVVADEAHDVTAVAGLLPELAKLPGQRASAGHGLRAGGVTAFADDVLMSGQADVSDIAGGALGTAVDLPSGDDAAADAGAGLSEFKYAYNQLVNHGEDIARSIDRVARFGYDTNSSNEDALPDHVVGVDLGGSNVRIALSEIAGRPVADVAARRVRGASDAVVGQIAALSRELAAATAVDWPRIGAVAVGVPGVLHPVTGGVHRAPNLPPFADVDLAGDLGQALGVPVAVDNDVNMAALAEHRRGHGAGIDDFVFVAVGTGIGMGIVAGGRLVHGATGGAGEIGEMQLGADPFDPANQLRGPLDETVGGLGVARRFADRTGADPESVTAIDVYDRAGAGDANARAVLDEQARALALAVVSVHSTLDPALVVFGGGIGSRDELVSAVRAYVARLTVRTIRTEVSALGEGAGLAGAVELARQHANGHGHTGRPTTTTHQGER